MAALYYHFPSKLDLLHEFLDESYDVVLTRVERRLDELVDPTAVRCLDEVVATLIASVLHDEFARLAANVAWREYNRLPPLRYRTVAAKRARLLDVVESVVAAGVDAGDFAVDEPREAARAIITLATTLVKPFDEIGRPLPEVIALYQRFARALARAGS